MQQPTGNLVTNPVWDRLGIITRLYTLMVTLKDGTFTWPKPEPEAKCYLLMRCKTWSGDFRI